MCGCVQSRMKRSSRKCCLWSLGFGEVVIVWLEREGQQVHAARGQGEREAHLLGHDESRRLVQHLAHLSTCSFTEPAAVLNRRGRDVERVVVALVLGPAQPAALVPGGIPRRDRQRKSRARVRRLAQDCLDVVAVQVHLGRRGGWAAWRSRHEPALARQGRREVISHLGRRSGLEHLGVEAGLAARDARVAPRPPGSPAQLFFELVSACRPVDDVEELACHPLLFADCPWPVRRVVVVVELGF